MLELKNVYKDYIVDKKPFTALKNINITFQEKGFVSILGPSGCGKTTLLNLIGGLDQYTKGDLIIDKKSTKEFNDSDWDAYRNKRVGFVFQSYNLVPHLTVLANVEISLTLTGINKKERQKRAMEALTKVGLESVIKKKPNQLSGGQMQRVAIARALVNNPTIILADEPTGALDSVTSVQVMDILKQVSEDRLVIMVTHNVELANKYSTRIIKLKDGVITHDSASIHLKKENKITEKEENKHTHMSFTTALGSSFRNLLTKKGRTILTVIAASFGIIGVSLVLAMSNGFSKYVSQIEATTASMVPITISPFVTTSIKKSDPGPAWPDDPVIKPYTEDISSLMVIHRNKITKDYAEYCKGLTKDPNHFASSILENHDYLDFNLFTERPKLYSQEKEIIKVNQFASAGAAASIISGTTNLPSTIFHEIYGDKNYINSLYDVIAGTYPKEELEPIEGTDDKYTAEVCLVCDRYNAIPSATLYALGLSPTNQASEGQTISFDDLLNHEYRAFLPDKIYHAVSSTPVTKEISVRDLAHQGDKTSTNVNDLSTTSHNKTMKAYIDVTTKKKGSSEYFYKDKLQDLYKNKYDIKIKISGIIRVKKDSILNLMPGSIAYPSSLKKYFVDRVSRYDEFANIARSNWGITASNNYNLDQLNWKVFIELYKLALLTNNTTNLLSTLNYVDLSPIQFYDILTDFQDDDGNYIPICREKNQYTIFQKNNYSFANEYKIPNFEYETIEGHQVMKGIHWDSIDSIIDPITYVNGYSTITSILVFPRGFSNKQRVISYLDAWNVNKAPENQVKYSDIAGTLTDAVGNLINVISIVLICFSAISLLVSCVMTGIITYVSVIERTKEIGILRAIGARKKDVGRLFEAESVIIGVFAGLVGVIITFILEMPVSIIISNMFPQQSIGMICNLNPIHALILVFISGILTFISGFIPAHKAAKKDPVVALRSE